MLAGACLMVAGAGLFVFARLRLAPWLLIAGAVAFTAMQAMQSYGGGNQTIKRLRRIVATSDAFFILAGLLMLEDTLLVIYRIFLNAFETGHTYYLTWVHNKWVLALLIAALLQLYATQRISRELGKESGRK